MLINQSSFYPFFIMAPALNLTPLSHPPFKQLGPWHSLSPESVTAAKCKEKGGP